MSVLLGSFLLPINASNNIIQYNNYFDHYLAKKKEWSTSRICSRQRKVHTSIVLTVYVNGVLPRSKVHEHAPLRYEFKCTEL